MEKYFKAISKVSERYDNTFSDKFMFKKWLVFRCFRVKNVYLEIMYANVKVVKRITRFHLQ